MRKNFLILMLLALLPLGAWAVSADLATKPTLTLGLVYDGNQKTLLSGTAELPADYFITPGCVVYQVTSNDKAPNEVGAVLVGDETTAFPTATNAGKYYVWYKVLADGELYDDPSAWTKIGGTFVRISSATPTIKDPTPAERTYNGDYQSLLAQPGSTTFGTLKYKLGSSEWIEWGDENFATTIKGLNAGEYTVNLKVEAEDESETPDWVEATKNFIVTIAPKNLAGEDVTISYVGPAKTYVNGTPTTITLADVKVTVNGVDLATDGTDFALGAYTNNNKAGDASCALIAGTNGNYAGGSVTFNIAPKTITAGMFDVKNVTYTGLTITQEDLITAGTTGTDVNALVAKVGDADGDFTLETTAKNATAANGATVTIKGVGNYDGTIQKTFTVNKAELIVNATDVTVACLTTVTDDVLAGHYTLTGWVGDDATADPKPAVTGAPVIANAGSTAAVGTQEDKITITGVGTLAFAEGVPVNYTFTVTGSVAADLIVEAIPLTIAFKENIPAFYYKDEVPAFDDLAALKANFFDISTPNAVTAMTIKMYDSEDAEVAAGTELTVGETYTLKVTAETHNVSYLLTDEIADKTITVQKLPIKIIAQDQNVAYPANELALDKNDEMVSEAYTSWTDALVTIANPAGTAYAKGDFTAKYGEVWKKDFIEKLEWTGDKTLKNPGKIVVTLKEGYDAAHFEVTKEDGTITLTGVPAGITLNRVASADFAKADKNTAAGLIEQWDGATLDVTFSDFTMLAEKWYPLVLPFATDVATISEKFGYAIVNILSDNQPDIAEGKVNLKLWMQEIPAGQPFVVKIYKEKNMNTVTFDDVQIDNAEPIDAKTDVSFIGTYTGKTGGFRSNQLYFSTSADYGSYYTGNATNKTYLRPLGAYFELTNGVEAREIIFEEADGTATAIKVVANGNEVKSNEGWYNLNGVKLQSAPTEKGVYINNGKKVVLK